MSNRHVKTRKNLKHLKYSSYIGGKSGSFGFCFCNLYRRSILEIFLHPRANRSDPCKKIYASWRVFLEIGEWALLMTQSNFQRDNNHLRVVAFHILLRKMHPKQPFCVDSFASEVKK